MNGRQNLYRLQYWLLAERQRYLEDLETLAARLRADVENLGREIDEAGSSKTSAELKAVYPMVVGPLVERRDKLVRTIAEIETQIVEARDAVATSQQEVKVFEASGAYRGFAFEDRRVRRTRRTA
jgi:F0F1-type ATP synthase membrane subunit b/b'